MARRGVILCMPNDCRPHALGEPTIIVLPLTTQVHRAKEPLHITIQARDRLEQTCQVVPEQPRTLDRRRLVDGPLTRLRPEEMVVVERSLTAVLGLHSDLG